MPTDEELAFKLFTGDLIISETKGKRRHFAWGYPKHGRDEQEALRALARILRDLARTSASSLSNPNWPVLQAVADALNPDVDGRKLVFKKPRKGDAPKDPYADMIILATITNHIEQNGGKINEAKRATVKQLGIGPATVKRIWTNKRKIAKAAHVRFED